ncbi:hypothetical protein PWY87_07210 [Kribbella solani]|uniref:hypothetical protein n=1 Tax=Kribbella solani TaxID=236067 RepID=UPI0029A05102|nr:hypothetical protein [Kribbella solani]MDX2969319.1 hypothetical protein [Kribbella solani]MDX3001450.1 hypothetical protein [Kribbella solani]
MSSQDFPTYGRGDEPEQRPGDEHHYAPPTPYGGSSYGPGQQPAPEQFPYAQPQPYGAAPQQHTQHPTQPPNYRPGVPFGAPASPMPHELPAYGRDQPVAPRDPRAARVVGLAAFIAVIYGLLVLTVQRVALREISQAPGSPLNHPLRTDVLDAIGQLLLVIVGAAALVMWLRDVIARRKAGRQPDLAELSGLILVAVSLVPILVWVILVLSTGLGSSDGSVHRLPTAYGWGGFGLLLLAVGLFLGYRELKPAVPNPVVQGPPAKAPWE